MRSKYLNRMLMKASILFAMLIMLLISYFEACRVEAHDAIEETIDDSSIELPSSILLEDLSDADEEEVINEDISDDEVEEYVDPYSEYSTMYVLTKTDFKASDSNSSSTLCKLSRGDSVLVSSDDGSEFIEVIFDSQVGYVESDDLSYSQPDCYDYIPYSEGDPILNTRRGWIEGPSGKETYYNLPMKKCIEIMESLGYDYDVWERSDGCKMYGEYIMIATDTHRFPKGSILELTLGPAIVVDHCPKAAETKHLVIDVAVNW